MDLPTFMLMKHTPKFLPRQTPLGKKMFDWKGNFVSEDFPKDLRLNKDRTSVFGKEALKLMES